MHSMNPKALRTDTYVVLKIFIPLLTYNVSISHYLMLSVLIQ